MDTMIITTDNQTITRMAVIAKRTDSEFMAGAKAMMHFVYQKKNGELREAWGTTNRSLVQKHVNGNGDSRERYATTAYFDVEKGNWRSFRWKNIVTVF